LARIVSIDRVCSKQQSTFSNKGVSIYGELWKRTKNRGDIWRKRKVEKAIEFVERMKKMQKEVGAALKKAQEDMKRQVNKRRKESKNWKKGDRVLLSTKDLVFKERLAKKLGD